MKDYLKLFTGLDVQGIPGLETMFERTSITLAIKHLWCFGRMLGSDVSVEMFSDLGLEVAVRAIVNSPTFPLVDDISRIHPEHLVAFLMVGNKCCVRT